VTADAPLANPEAVNWRDSLGRGAFEEALGRTQALELIGRGEPEAKQALERVVELIQALRAKAYADARRVSLEGINEVLSLEVNGIPEAIAALERAEKASRSDLETAETALHEARAQPLTRAEAENQLGVLAALAGDSSRAQTHFEAALLADPRHYRAITNLGNLSLEAGEVTVAEARYREALTINPDYPTAHNNLAAALRKQGKRSASVAALKRSQRLAMKAFSKPPSNPDGSVPTVPTISSLWANPRVRTVVIVVLFIAVYILFRR
jgi:tetratricopeptide (TPR) repeat protein